MNDLHLKYKMDTGNAWPTRIDNCEADCIDNDQTDCENIYKYIKWLEEKFENLEKEINSLKSNEKNKKPISPTSYHDRHK
jgi:hypothetical protein